MKYAEGTGATPLAIAEAPSSSMTRLSLLVDLSSMLAREVDLDVLLDNAAETLAEALRAERATIWLLDAERTELRARVAVLPEVSDLRLPLGRGIAGWVARTGEVLRIRDASQDARFDGSADRRTGFLTRSVLAVPIREREGAPVRGVIQVLNRTEGVFDEEDERYLVVLGLQLGRALSWTTLRAEDATSSGLTLRGPFNRIVGRGPAMEAVYRRMSLAAQTDARVLLRGESGTGKTLLARAIHVNSPRQGGPFVTVDCATLPEQLIESELFGHERGAFTSADRQVRGKVELAGGGTLFLDEIAELSVEAQAKLLRFLQSRTFERVGGRQTLQADLRLIAATHQDLERRVKEGLFRQDLYYRLRVVEIRVPALRERGPEAVLRLARHFAELFAERYGRPSPRFAPQAEQRLLAHTWPGNVRELEHWIESALVLAPDGEIRASNFPAPEGHHEPLSASPERSLEVLPMPPDLPLEEVQRRYAEAAVEAAEGNKSEAARRLGISRNRLSRLLRRKTAAETEKEGSSPSS